MNNLHNIKMERDKVGICNICGKKASLSWDHIPPKGSIIYNDVEILSIINNFLEIEKPPREFSQNGMKFRTICSECNNLVGSKYDIIFNDFIKRLAILIDSNIGKEESIDISVDTESLIKSIFAHLVAAKGEIENTVPDEKMKGIVIGDKDINDINIHYWFYPFTINQVVRDILIHKISTGKSALVSLLKLYPIAFLVTDSDMFLKVLPRLNDYYNIHEKKNTTIKFDLSLYFDYKWPMIMDNDTLIAGGQSITSSVIAVPRFDK